MNILLINHYAGSSKHGMEYRPYYLAREWVKLGHSVTIIASSFSHLHNQGPKLTGNIQEEIVDGIRYVWIKTSKYKGNGMGRVYNMLNFTWKLLSFHKDIVNKYNPDLVIASSPHPFVIFGANKMTKISNAKLVFEVRDLGPISLVELGNISRFNPLVVLMQMAENFAYKKADKVVSLLPKSISYMSDHGMNPNKFIYIPNGMNMHEWSLNESLSNHEHMEFLSRLKKQKKFIVGYAGSLGVANALEYLIQSASILKSFPVSFVLIGKGPEKSALIKSVERLGLTNVHFLPPVDKSYIPSLLNCMDFLYIGWKKEPLYRFGISPNKLIDYMMAAKPVIHSIEAGNDLVKESGCGISITPEDPQAIADAVLKLIKMPNEKIDEMGKLGRRYALLNHDYTVLAKRFLSEVIKKN
jgi:glycosyltransferase involved in cell wall biosynthesis